MNRRRARGAGTVSMVLMLVAAAACGGGNQAGPPETSGVPTTVPPSVASTTTTTIRPTSTTVDLSSLVPSPLSGLPLDDDVDLERPAVAVKIDNHRDARPQVGLDVADLVFEEEVESLTRFAAVFWTTDTEVGPIRSGRTSDLDLLASLGSPVLAWSGGNDVVRQAIRASVLIDRGAERFGELYRRSDSRAAPHNLMSDVATLAEAGKGTASAPMAPLQFVALTEPPSGPWGVRSSGATIDFSGVLVQWAWDDTSETWLRFQDGGPHVVANGTQVSASNVVILGTPYGISSADSGSPEARTVGSGGALVLGPDGTALEGTWDRASGGSPWIIRDSSGVATELYPGRTWIELPRPGKTTELEAGAAKALLG